MENISQCCKELDVTKYSLCNQKLVFKKAMKSNAEHIKAAFEKLAIPVSVSQNIWQKLRMYSSYKDTFLQWKFKYMFRKSTTDRDFFIWTNDTCVVKTFEQICSCVQCSMTSCLVSRMMLRKTITTWITSYFCPLTTKCNPCISGINMKCNICLTADWRSYVTWGRNYLYNNALKNDNMFLTNAAITIWNTDCCI